LGICALLQIDENVYREIINHRSLRHPNIIRFKEVSSSAVAIPPIRSPFQFFQHSGPVFIRNCAMFTR
jgi:hypothetical protein